MFPVPPRFPCLLLFKKLENAVLQVSATKCKQIGSEEQGIDGQALVGV